MKNPWSKLKNILELSLPLAKANFKLKNEGTFFGIFWYLLEPFFLFLVILGIQGAFGGGTIENYPLYLLLGLIMFNFFSIATTTATTIITNSSNFIKSMKINPETLIISKVLEGIFSHFFEIILFFGFMIFFKIPLVWILIYPLTFAFFVLFVLGFSFFLATFGVYVNDLNNAWKVITKLLFFLTPLFHIPEKGSLVYNLNLFNPLFYFISIARDLIIYNEIPELWLVKLMILSSVGIFLIGIFAFNKYKVKFAEYV